MSRRALSKEEFMRRALADLDSENKLIPAIKQVAPKELKRKCIIKRKKNPFFESIERMVVYA